MKRFAIAAKFLVIVIALAIILGCSIYKYAIGPVSSDSGKVDLIISKGSTWYSVANDLKTNNLIRSESFYKFYVKLFKPGELQAGKYSLSPDMGVEKIVKQLEQGSTYNEDDVMITFKEGINMRAIAKLISDNTNNSYDSVFSLLKDDSYLDELINNYWFITKDVKNSKIYYSLEGYLFPETYSFNKNSSVKDIFKLMLDQMNVELSKYKTQIEKSNMSIHELLTLSSVVELEVGKANDRNLVAGVFVNRLNNNWTLGSDVTTYYAEKIDVWNGLTKSQLNACNDYNTRGTCVKGLPVSPICIPSKQSIEASVNPVKTDMFYFVADCNGVTYLTKTEADHDKKIQELKKNNKWCE